MGSWKEKWADRDRENKEIRQSGRVRVIRVKGRLHVISPESDIFMEGARELSGRWKRRSGVWSFPGRSERLLRELIARVYGADALDDRSL